MPPLAIRGIPFPYLIVAQTSAEATTGRATLIAVGDLDLLIEAIRKAAPERADLVEKFENLK